MARLQYGALNSLFPINPLLTHSLRLSSDIVSRKYFSTPSLACTEACVKWSPALHSHSGLPELWSSTYMPDGDSVSLCLGTQLSCVTLMRLCLRLYATSTQHHA